MSSAVNAITQAQNQEAVSSAANSPASSRSAIDALAQKETFLKLLVAQIKNQNPLNPADGIEFVSQLAQFSQLEQMMQIRSELETIRKELEPKQGTDSGGQPPVQNP